MVKICDASSNQTFKLHFMLPQFLNSVSSCCFLCSSEPRNWKILKHFMRITFYCAFFFHRRLCVFISIEHDNANVAEAMRQKFFFLLKFYKIRKLSDKLKSSCWPSIMTRKENGSLVVFQEIWPNRLQMKLLFENVGKLRVDTRMKKQWKGYFYGQSCWFGLGLNLKAFLFPFFVRLGQSGLKKSI